MKELSIKEKAEAYEEALERARNLHKDAVEMENNMNTKICEIIFPELKESEDERIRKELICFLETEIPHCNARDKYIAWVEKQREKKSAFDIDIPFGAKDSELIEASYYIPESFHAEIEGNHVVIKKGEQKPAWSEEDEYCRHQLIVFCENCMVQDAGAKRCAHWLESLKERVLPKPKQEWSEEDKKIIDRIESEFLALHRGDYKNIDFNDVDSLSVLNWVRKIKSLCFQSRWKPSDEQMKQLGWIAEQNKNNMIGKELMTLYQDLKKAKGE